jgi:DNA-directed RNA polymerase specialized sigma subunit
MTQSDLGAELGVSQVQVSRLLGRIFADLRDRLTPVAAAA